MEYMFVLLKKLIMEVQESNTLSHLIKLRENFLIVLDAKIQELRKLKIKEIDVGQTIFVKSNEEVLKCIVTKVTNSERIHAKGLEGKHFNRDLSFPPDIVVEDPEEFKNG